MNPHVQVQVFSVLSVQSSREVNDPEPVVVHHLSLNHLVPMGTTLANVLSELLPMAANIPLEHRQPVTVQVELRRVI